MNTTDSDLVTYTDNGLSTPYRLVEDSAPIATDNRPARRDVYRVQFGAEFCGEHWSVTCENSVPVNLRRWVDVALPGQPAKRIAEDLSVELAALRFGMSETELRSHLRAGYCWAMNDSWS